MGVLGLDDDKVNKDGRQHCRHPVYSLVNDTISHTFTHLPPLSCNTRSKQHCSYSEGLIRVADGWICLLQSVVRPEGMDSTVKYNSPQLIRDNIALPAALSGDFFRLSCVPRHKLGASEGNTDVQRISALIAANNVDEQHFISRIHKYPEDRPPPCPQGRCLPYNVFVLGIGSLSHLSFRRLLPKTYEYFTSTLNSVKFEGYNVVGHSGSDALLPLLTGLDESKLPETRVNKVKSHYVDKLDLLWNTYDNHGYMTLYAEDHPDTDTFNNRFNGFERPPTAHYMRPFWLAAKSHNMSAKHCLGKKARHQYVLDYLLDFHSAYKEERKFSLAMLKGLTQADVMLAQHMDTDLVQFLNKMEPYLQDSLVLLMSDFGVLPKQSWSNRQSKVESRMPLMSVYLPTSFIQNYSGLARAMISNEDKLVTPYDVHHMLKDIVDIPRLYQMDPRDKGRFGQSLFKPISISRTCSSAGVDVHWCACHTQFSVQPDEVDTIQIGDLILVELNKHTSSHREHCSAYQSIRVLANTRLVPNEQIKAYDRTHNTPFSSHTLLDENYYLLTFSASTAAAGSPADTYEVTFEHRKEGVLAMFSNMYRLVSDIVRLDTSVNQNYCVPDIDILRYCSCTT